MSKRYLLIGASAASMGAVLKLRQLDPEAQITIFSAEKELPYNKCLLADFLAGIATQDKLNIYKAGGRVTLELDARIVSINSAQKTITTHTGVEHSYDVLFLGMGSGPWIPNIPGIEATGVFTFHTLADTLAIQDYIQKNQCKKAVVCGAGLSGMEVADSLKAQGIEVTVVEKSSQVLPHLLTRQAAEFLHDHMRSVGINLILQEQICSIENIDAQVAGVTLSNNSFIPADILIMATGLRPNTLLCQEAGITVSSNGVVVDAFMRTSQPDIYAAGDLIEVTDTLTGNRLRSCMWPDAMQQGMHAALAMVGQPKSYPGPAIIVSSAFFGLKFAHAGIVQEPLKIATKQDFFHAINQNEGILQGFQVLGKRHDLGLLRRLILTKQPLLDTLSPLFSE